MIIILNLYNDFFKCTDFLNMKQTNYYGWQGYLLKSKNIELGIIPLGGRIISLKAYDEELLFVEKELVGKTPDLTKLDTQYLADKKRELGFMLWGGDKTWVAPESAWIASTPPLDLDSQNYALSFDDENTITLTSPICRETGLQLIRKISITSNDIIELHQTMLNRGQKPIKKAIWDVTQLLKPFEILVPASESAIKPDTRFEASTTCRHDFVIAQESDQTKILCEQPVIYKFGALIEKGQITAQTKRSNKIISMTRYFDIEPEKHYPDDHMIEVYNSPDKNYLELEVLAPLTTLAPGEKTSHNQRWEFQLKITTRKCN